MISYKPIILYVICLLVVLGVCGSYDLIFADQKSFNNTNGDMLSVPADDLRGGDAEMKKYVGQPVDIASSAYEYRADNKSDANQPESWFALMHYAGLPLNKPVDVNNSKIKQVTNALLWEEIRPIDKIVLEWPSGAKAKPSPQMVKINALMNDGTASSWWNNLDVSELNVEPAVSKDRLVYTYDVDVNTCGIIISLNDDASQYDIPQIKALVANTWKKMDIEIEWGFDKSTANKDYSGKIETYDGILKVEKSLPKDSSTDVIDSASWKSSGKGNGRRGIKASMLYMGTSKWRDVQPFTSQRDDVARTIITLWTKAGNFSFLAADLENGPIYAPEYGFFIRRTSKISKDDNLSSYDKPIYVPISRDLMLSKMDSIGGEVNMKGWGTDSTPWFGGNPSASGLNIMGISIPSKGIAMHPGSNRDVSVGWQSPISGLVSIRAKLTHAQSGGNGIDWHIAHEKKDSRNVLARGSSYGSGIQDISPELPDYKSLAELNVDAGDSIYLSVGPRGTHTADTNVVEFVITELNGSNRVWDLRDDIIESIHENNPHKDKYDNPDVWGFYSQELTISSSDKPLLPPLDLSSNAKSAKEYIKELKSKKLMTVRQRVREHGEQTIEYAIAGICGRELSPNWPIHPSPPDEFKSAMKVRVPSERLTAQWDLANWHLLRHAPVNPKTGRIWFNDHPYGILAAETYMVLKTLDMLGSHAQAEDGFYQWTSLPMQPSSDGHHEWALADYPNGLFTDGLGCLTHAEGPEGSGGHMDGVHAFGPGAIGYALVEHYLMTGDKDWLRSNINRIKANAEWMLRQRQVMKNAVPGGNDLWCKGLQPPLQVTPDSGGLWMQFYEAEAYYWMAVDKLADALSEIDIDAGSKLQKLADYYKNDLLTAVERSIALSPIVPTRDGAYHSVIPFGCYVRGLSTGAWGWMRDGSGRHVGPLYWETVQSAASLISPAGLLPIDDVRVQGYLDVLEDRLLLENYNVMSKANGDWFNAGWQYQIGLERTANIHLDAGDTPLFLRSWLNGYAANILPNNGYIFREHTVGGPPDKIYEEASFIERFRNMLVMESGDDLLLMSVVPKVWFKNSKRISVENAPTHFGNVSYETISNVKHGSIRAEIDLPNRKPIGSVILKLRHPDSLPMKSVLVNGAEYTDFNAEDETIRLKGFSGKIAIEVKYK